METLHVPLIALVVLVIVYSLVLFLKNERVRKSHTNSANTKLREEAVDTFRSRTKERLKKRNEELIGEVTLRNKEMLSKYCLYANENCFEECACLEPARLKEGYECYSFYQVPWVDVDGNPMTDTLRSSEEDYKVIGPKCKHWDSIKEKTNVQ